MCCHRDQPRAGGKWVLLALLLGIVTMILGRAEPAGAADAAPAGWRDSAPAAGAVMAPNFGAGREGPLLTWLEKLPAGGHALRFSRRRGGANPSWSAPVTIASGTDFFANWADFPAAAEAADGT